MIYIDDIPYESASEAPDLGSLIGEHDGPHRHYKGLSKDASKLPTAAKYSQYTGRIAEGSSCFFVDTMGLKLYDVSTDTWY